LNGARKKVQRVFQQAWVFCELRPSRILGSSGKFASGLSKWHNVRHREGKTLQGAANREGKP
jgi:hypothetical protein